MRPASVRRRRTQGGNALLETGLCLVVLMLIVCGIAEYSLLNYANNFCAYAAQQGARYASVRGASSVGPLATSPSPCGTSCTNVSSGDPTTAYIQSLAVGLNLSSLTVNTQWSAASGNGNAAGGTVTVTVSYAYTPIFSITDVKALTVNSASSMTVLQ